MSLFVLPFRALFILSLSKKSSRTSIGRACHRCVIVIGIVILIMQDMDLIDKDKPVIDNDKVAHANSTNANILNIFL